MARRQQIRAALANLHPDGDLTVYDYHPLQAHSVTLPAISIFCQEAELNHDHSHYETSTATFEVQVLDQAISETELVTTPPPSAYNLDARLDEIARPLQQAIQADPTLGGLVDEIKRTKIEYSLDDKLSLGTLIYTYTVIYTDED